MIIFVTIFGVLFAILSWRRLDLAAAFTIMALPAYQIRFNLGFLPLTILDTMIFILFLVWFAKSARAKELLFLLSFPRRRESRQNIKSYPFSYEIILLLIIAFVSAGVAGFSNASLGILKAYFIEPIMFFIVFINIFKFKENRENIFNALAISAFVVSMVAIYQQITGDLLPLEWQNSGRVTSIFTYPNAVGLYIAPIIFLLFGWLVSNIQYPILKKLDIKYWILNIAMPLLTIVLSVTAVFFAHSQGAMIGLAAAFGVFGMLYNFKTRVATVIIAAAALVALSLNPVLFTKLESKIMLRDLDGQIRQELWKETKKMLADGHFIFGAGLANYQKTIAPYHQEGIFVWDYNDPNFLEKLRASAEFRAAHWQPLEIYLYPHNIILNFWSELGFMGMLLFIWIIVKYFYIGITLLSSAKKNVARHSSLVIGLLCAMVVIVVHGLVDVPYFKNDLAVLFWVLIGMMGVINIEMESKNEELKSTKK